MKHLTLAARILTIALTLGLGLGLGVPAFAHGNNEHVRGVVTQISAQSITVQLADKTSKTLTLSSKTTFARAGKPAAMTDVKVGDRVVIDVPKSTTEALEVTIGAGLKKTPL